MHFVTLLIGIWLLPKVNTLNCYECVPGTSETCTDTAKECPSPDNLCAAMTLVTYTGGSKDKEIKAKMCALARDCVEGSANFGSDKTVIVSECCTSELCNSQYVSEHKSIPNGKTCYSCEGQQCTKTLNCEGDQDYCIKSRMNIGGEIQTLKGCASKMMCSENPSVLFQTYIGSGSSCCQGDYCNSASSASAVLLLLFVSLILLVLFS
ncbi:urokinase plasminogen activator surface receptor-like isoform X2 [Girardinichthys multiradiatus]|uniref:urokinase plasminogen activator surface receptor-like isoform X2 n=1 Tax=Girardinichthys multiradiatus TaxID=208333 RepID=UPI001FAE4133|nr:urokinase plasminogen activator surface receptor-like isoform X2 [Girardinichthys multiradiatus]